MDFDVTKLEMLPSEEEEGLLWCWITCWSITSSTT